jgi:hypothetical protein
MRAGSLSTLRAYAQYALRRTCVRTGKIAACVVWASGFGCGSGSGNDNIQGTCLPPAPGAVPLTCNISCSCGSGGKCDDHRCVSCDCTSVEMCDEHGACVGSGPSLWYSGAFGQDAPLRLQQTPPRPRTP